MAAPEENKAKTAALPARNIEDMGIEPIYAGLDVKLDASLSLAGLDDEIARFKKSLDSVFAGFDYTVATAPPKYVKPKPPYIPGDFKRLCVECGADITELPEERNLCSWHQSLKDRHMSGAPKGSMVYENSIVENMPSSELIYGSDSGYVERKPMREADTMPVGPASAGGKATGILPDEARLERIQTTLEEEHPGGAPQGGKPPHEGHTRNEGMKYFENREWDKATVEFSNAIRIAPNNPRLYYMRGVSYYKLMDWERAEADLRRSLNLDPNYAKANRDYGKLLMKRGNFEAAEIYIRRALQLDPEIRRGRELLEKAKRGQA